MKNINNNAEILNLACLRHLKNSPFFSHFKQAIDEICLSISSIYKHEFQSFPLIAENKNPLFRKILIPF